MDSINFNGVKLSYLKNGAKKAIDFRRVPNEKQFVLISKSQDSGNQIHIVAGKGDKMGAKFIDQFDSADGIHIEKLDDGTYLSMDGDFYSKSGATKLNIDEMTDAGVHKNYAYEPRGIMLAIKKVKNSFFGNKYLTDCSGNINIGEAKDMNYKP